MKKQLAVVMSAAVLTVGGWAWTGSAAHAAAGTYTVTVSINGEAARQQAVTYPVVFVSNWLSSLSERVSGLYDVDQDIYAGKLADGASISGAAGVSSSTIAADLSASFTKDAENEVLQGNLASQEASDAAKLLESLLPNLLSQTWTGYDAAAAGLNFGREALNNRLSQMVSLTSGVSDISTADLRAALKAGQTLVEASGLSESELSSYLLSGLNQDLDLLVQTNRLTQEESSGLKSEAALAVAKIVTTSGYEAEENEWMDVYAQSLINQKLDGIARLAAIYADEDYSDVASALAAGQTLQAATGVDAAELAAQLQSGLDQAFDAAWISGALSAAKVEEWKAEAQNQLLAAVTTSGYGTAGEADQAIVKESLRSIVSQTASYAGLELAALRSQLDSGSTLASAADLSANELVSVLEGPVAAYIDQAVANGWLKAEAAASTKAEAKAELLAAVDKTGYTGDVEADAYLQERVGRVVYDATAVTGIPAAQILEGLAQGRSLASAAQTDAATLYKGLIKQTSKDINALVTAGALNSHDADTLKADYAADLLESLNPSL